jgi:putative ABC transport system ATP-binding protein
MLKLNNISKGFLSQQVLKGINLEIGQKEMISIMGRSGSGKSTLLSIIAGLITPDSGEVTFLDSQFSLLDQEQLARLRLNKIGLIFQDFKLLPSLSVFDNIHLGIFPLSHLSPTERQGRVEDFCKEVGLEDKMGKRVSDLSGGEQQRVAIARCLAKKPDLILADEPTGNLDSKTASSIMDLFKRLHQEFSTTFVIVTHDREIAGQTEKTVHIQDGEIR